MPHDSSFPFSEEFQYAILNLMMTDDVFLAKCSIFLQEEFFNNRYLAWVFRAIRNYYNDYKVPPVFGALENEAKKHDPDKQRPYFEVLNKAVQKSDIDPEYVRKELTGFVQQNKFVDAYKKVANLYNSKNTKSAYTFMKEKIDELIAVDLEEDDMVDFTEIRQYMEEASEQKRTAVPTGIGPIDQAMHGGLTKGSLTVLLSATNTGKTMALINFLYHAVCAGKKVIFVEHEDERNPTTLRIVSRFTGIPYNKLLCPNLLTDSENGMIDHIIERLGEKPKLDPEARKIMFKFMYGPDTSIEKLCSWLRLKKKEFDFDIFICDYGQFIKTDERTNNIREKDIIVHKKLKQIGLELDIAVLTCAQGTREGQRINQKGSDYLRLTDISECFDIVRRATNVITMNRSDEQASRNELIYYLAKVKHGKNNIAVKCETDYDRCMIHDPDRMWVVSELNPMLANEEDPFESGLK